MSPQTIRQLFEKTQFSYELLMQIFEAVEASESANYEWLYSFLNELQYTSRFNTTRMFLTRADKQRMAQVLAGLPESDRANINSIYKL